MTPIVLLLVGCSALRPEIPEYTGTIEVTEVDVSAIVPGRIETVAVHEGDRVASGDALFTLDTSLLDLEKSLRESQVVMAGAGVDAAEAQSRAVGAQIAYLERESDRVERLESAGVATAQQKSAIKGQLDVAWAQSAAARQAVVAAGAQVGQAEVGLQLADQRLSEAGVLAPVGGVVLSRNREPGEVVGAGMSVLTLGDLDHPRLRVYAPLLRVEALTLGAPVEVYLDAHDTPFAGKVSRIATEAEFTPRDILTPDERVKRVFAVDIALEPAPGLYPGVPAEARFVE